MNTKILTTILCIFILILVIELVRREKLTFKYAVGWLLVLGLGIFFVIFDQCLYRLADILGFQLPSNFIFFAVLCGFVFLSLELTIFLCQQNNRNDRMAQKIGLIENEIEQLKKEFHQKKKD